MIPNTTADRVLLPLSFDPLPLKESLTLLDENEWIPHFNQDGFEGSWKIIPLRGPAGETHPIRQAYNDPTATEFADTEFAVRCNAIKAVMDQFHCPLRAVRLLSLAPGSKIKEHSDLELSFEDGEARIHIPIRTNPEVHFFLNQERIILNEGECWYLRLSDPHRVENAGNSPRIHLILDCVVDEWLEALVKNTPFV